MAASSTEKVQKEKSRGRQQRIEAVEVDVNKRCGLYQWEQGAQNRQKSMTEYVGDIVIKTTIQDKLKKNCWVLFLLPSSGQKTRRAWGDLQGDTSVLGLTKLSKVNYEMILPLPIQTQ